MHNTSIILARRGVVNKLIYTYALIRSLYDQGDDYIDSFWPFAIQVLEEKEYTDTSPSSLKTTLKVLPIVQYRPPYWTRTTLLSNNKPEYYIFTARSEEDL